jgi:LCP family protein required for cell wall assembly
MSSARPRARRSQLESRYSRRRAPAILATVLICGLLIGAGLGVVRLASFLHGVLNVSNPLSLAQSQIEPPEGSIAWKLKHGQQVNVLALGYGGPENDAPLLTDSLMIVSIDPSTQRVMEVSIPRDLWVGMSPWQDGRVVSEKINAAFEIGSQPQSWGRDTVTARYRGKDGGGYLAEDTISRLTGVRFDRYVGVDFAAFRDMVNALGGIDVHLDGPLDDCHYPDYHDGYMNHGVPLGFQCPPGAGIHFPAGTYHVDGERALELARSRDAIEPDQANDFGRSRRQQMIISAIRQKATSTNALLKAPQLMDALQADFKTDMDLTDLKALYDYMGKTKEGSILHLAVTDTNLVSGYGPYTRGSCGPPDAFVLCPDDKSYAVWHHVFSNLFVSPGALGERAPVELVNASANSTDLGANVTQVLRPLGFATQGEGVRGRYEASTIIYDYSGGRYPRTVDWMRSFFGGRVVTVSPSPAPGGTASAQDGPGGTGVVVVMGGDFARRWYGLT